MNHGGILILSVISISASILRLSTGQTAHIFRLSDAHFACLGQMDKAYVAHCNIKWLKSSRIANNSIKPKKTRLFYMEQLDQRF